MKKLAAVFCIYFALISFMPTLRVLKAELASGCENACAESRNCSSDRKFPCENQRCLLTFSLNGAFVAPQIQQVSALFVQKGEKEYNNCGANTFIAAYSGSMWHPPERDSA